MLQQPNPYYWHNDAGYWPYPWGNRPIKTPWDRQRSSGKIAQLEELEGPENSVISNDIDQISLAPSPSTEYGELPFDPSMEASPLSSLPDLMNNDEAGPIAADTTNVSGDDLFGEQLWGTLDGSSLSIPDTGMWGETQNDPIASMDAETLAMTGAMTGQDPRFSIKDPEEAIFS